MGEKKDGGNGCCGGPLKEVKSDLFIRKRNESFAPNLEREGVLICPLPTPPPVKENDPWYGNLKPFQRLYYHQTMASVRKCKRFIPTSLIPKDSLDLQLQSRYIHSAETFPDKVDMVMQVETCTKVPRTFRVLRNTIDVSIELPEEIGHPLKIGTVASDEPNYNSESID